MQKLFKRAGRSLLVLLFLVLGLSLGLAKAADGLVAEEPMPDLSLVKSIDAANPQPGDTFNYILAYKNEGTAPATNVIISDTLTHTGQEYLTYVSGADTWNAGIKTVGFNIPTIPAGATGSVSFKVLLGNVPEGVTRIVNQAFITSDELKPKVPGSNCLVTIIDFQPKINLEIKKISSASTVAPNGEVAYEITLTNTGTKDAANLTLVDKWTEQAPGLSNYVAGSVDPAGVVDETNKTITWTISELKIGESQVFKYKLHVAASFSPSGTYNIINQACVEESNEIKTAEQEQTKICSDEVIVKVRYGSSSHKKEEPKEPVVEQQVLAATTEALPVGGGDIYLTESLLAVLGLLIISAFTSRYLIKAK